MDKFLLLLWNKLFLLKVTHTRFDGDQLHSQWVQWGDIEQLIHDCIEAHQCKTTGRLYSKSQTSKMDREYLHSVEDRLDEATTKMVSRGTKIRQLEERLQLANTDSAFDRVAMDRWTEQLGDSLSLEDRGESLEDGPVGGHDNVTLL